MCRIGHPYPAVLLAIVDLSVSTHAGVSFGRGDGGLAGVVLPARYVMANPVVTDRD